MVCEGKQEVYPLKGVLGASGALWEELNLPIIAEALGLRRMGRDPLEVIPKVQK